MDQGYIPGSMEEFIRVNGLIITCTVKVFIHGKMEENMTESISMIKR